ncbi:Protein N-acetyltransferase, RimJ/RimL family [Micromonospora pattaloongensis]|uniref:Protein N-acetyltransferase, RimJ/RimL family n=1 Tax=Micromonospora pattaloongensis TaxID=405436 RepID=A0A1H3P4V2_9ACTN|nr:GNAT family N-acetyltransferase [Micromonospora pattaloongensis]SDY96137.1 Protein N-acetyltransferase, RimJ/RimL family [Micromonospora pattaloongensis]
MHVFLETERLTLRRFTEADLDNLVALDADPEVMRYLTGGVPTPPEVIATRTLPRMLDYHRRFDNHGYWAAIDTSSGQFLGWFELRPGDDGRTDELELGYRLRRAAWGRGYATEGSRALLRRAFTELDAQRVYAQTMTVNVRSRRVMEKAGLTLVRTFHRDWPDPIDGAEHGEVEYALHRADWLRRDPQPGSAG